MFDRFFREEDVELFTKESVTLTGHVEMIKEWEFQSTHSYRV